VVCGKLTKTTIQSSIVLASYSVNSITATNSAVASQLALPEVWEGCTLFAGFGA